MRIGIFGGSFDPVHEGHLRAAAEALRARPLDAVWLLPARQPPHKPPCVASFADRVAMLERAVEGLEGVRVCAIEGERPGPSYTVETLEELSRRHPGTAWELLVGADMLADLPRWHRAADLLARVAVTAFGRPGVAWESAEAAFRGACPGTPLERVEFDPVDASSSALRERLRGAREAPAGIPAAVFAWIRQKGLYGAARGG